MRCVPHIKIMREGEWLFLAMDREKYLEREPKKNAVGWR